MIAHPLNETSWLSSIKPMDNVQVPAFYRTQFTLPENYASTLDTFLDTSGWTKVCILIFFVYLFFIIFFSLLSVEVHLCHKNYR